LHRNLFDGLTPLGFDYYAGHYRGEDFLCLRECEVRIRNDPRVGHPAAVVPDQMRLMAAEVVNVAEHRDILYAVNSRVVGEAEKLACLIEVAAALFVYFLEIHPYANGNGHVGRFLLITLLCRYGIFPARATPPSSSGPSVFRTHQPLSKWRPKILGTLHSVMFVNGRA
jgi:fido (protein-threonine AMPylation protein)